MSSNWPLSEEERTSLKQRRTSTYDPNEACELSKSLAANGNQSDNLLIECDKPEYDIEVQIALAIFNSSVFQSGD
jgi:hypothetical protein